MIARRFGRWSYRVVCVPAYGRRGMRRTTLPCSCGC